MLDIWVDSLGNTCFNYTAIGKNIILQKCKNCEIRFLNNLCKIILFLFKIKNMMKSEWKVEY